MKIFGKKLEYYKKSINPLDNTKLMCYNPDSKMKGEAR